MKPAIHPTWYPDAVVTCACGNSWTTGSTKKEIHTDVCNKCHPFFTGEQRIVDTAGQVERFMKRINAKEQIAATQPAAEEKKSKKERRRERHAVPVAEPSAPEAPLELPRAEIAPRPQTTAAPVAEPEVAPLAEPENITPVEGVDMAPAGVVDGGASVDKIIEPTETNAPQDRGNAPEPAETPRGTEGTFQGGTAEVTDDVHDVEMPDNKSGGKPQTPRKPRSSGPRKPKENAPKKEGE